MSNEITFISICEVCGKRDVPCRNHHVSPQRLLKTLTFEKVKQWRYQTIRICNKCNGYMHPENHLYEQIIYLKKQLGFLPKEEGDRLDQEIQGYPEEQGSESRGEG